MVVEILLCRHCQSNRVIKHGRDRRSVQRFRCRDCGRTFQKPEEDRGYTPAYHARADHARWGSEVVFVGTHFPGRGPFMADLLRRGVPLTIYGNQWEKAREWPLLQKA